MDETLVDNKVLTPFDRVIAASLGGTTTALLMCPFDVVKSRLQAQVTTIKPQPPSINHFTGTIDAFVKITKYEGISILWRGVTPTIAMTIPSNAIYFTAYESLKNNLQDNFQIGIFVAPIIAGFGARVLSSIATSPLEYIKTNLQATTPTEGIFRLFTRIIQTGGVTSLWSGLIPTLLRDAPFSAIYWSFYEIIKRKMIPMTKSKKSNFLVDFTSGAGGGTIAALITAPADVVKTRRQMIIEPNGESSVKMWEIAKKIVQEEGGKGLFKGIVPRVAKVAPSCAIMISSYELCKNYIAARKL